MKSYTKNIVASNYSMWLSLVPKSLETSDLATVSLLILLVALAVLSLQMRNRKLRSSSRNKRELRTVKWRFPFSFPVIGWIYTIHMARRHGVKLLDMLTMEYGHLFKVPVGILKFYGVSDADIIQKIVTSNNPNHLAKPRYFMDRVFTGALTDGLLSAEIPIWRPHRKILSKAFTYNSLQSYIGVMNDISQEMIKQMLLKASQTGEITGEQIYDIKYHHTVKIIANIVMGADILTDEENRVFQQSFRTWKAIVANRMVQPILLIDPIWWLHPQRREMDRNMDKMCQIIKKIIGKYKEKVAQRSELKIFNELEDGVGCKPFKCMLEEMLFAGMSNKEIIEEVLMFLTAGHETSALAISTLMFQLALHPEYQKKCRDEIDALFGAKTADSEYNRNVTMDDLSSLKYLEQCLKENLRLTPIVPFIIRRMDEGLKIDDDFEIEKNTNVFINIWSLQRNPKHYPDPEKFDPDRFLLENVKQRHFYSYLVFSSGARNCIGWKLSMMEMKIVACWILRHFEIFTNDKMENINFRFEITIMPEREIHLIFKKRNLGHCTIQPTTFAMNEQKND